MFSVIALLLGAFVTYIIFNIQQTFNLSIMSTIIINLLITISILYIIETVISPSFSEEWHTTTPGLFFVAIFFGLQILAYDNALIKYFV